MPTPRRDLRTHALDGAFAALRTQMDVPEAFPPEVTAAAAAAAARGPAHDRRDATGLPFVTIDPPGSKDLDQAVHVAPAPGGGMQVSYAIADVAAFVKPGDPVDVEAWSRGVSRYSPDRVTPLHPRELSEGAASLLPGVDRPAVLWTLTLDGLGELTDTHVERALVRSREQLDYATAQARIDTGGDEVLTELARVGRLRTEREWVRGGVSLELPDQEVTADDGGYDLRFRAPLPVEGWNAQLSLLTGHAAALLMVEAGIGILRTLPPPDADTVEGLRRRAWALGLPWPPEVPYPDFVRTLDPHDPAEAAMISLSAVGLRGAGYAAFTDDAVPEQPQHAGLAMVYAHVTAPLRRLVDRYASEVALALAAEAEVPDWVRERLPDLPRAMAQAGSRASALDRAVVDLVEAHLLADHVGGMLPATVVRSDDRGADVQLRNPAVLIRLAGDLPLGVEVMIRVDAVDLEARTVSATAAGPV